MWHILIQKHNIISLIQKNQSCVAHALKQIKKILLIQLLSKYMYNSSKVGS